MRRDETSRTSIGGEGQPAGPRVDRSAGDFFSGFAADWDSICGGRIALWRCVPSSPAWPRRDRVRYPIRRWRYRILGRCRVFHFHRTEILRVLAESGFGSPRLTYLHRSGGSFFVEAHV